MRVVIDLRWMRPGLAGGIENLSRSFLNELIVLDRVNSYRILVPGEVSCDFDLRYSANFHIEAIDGPGRLGAGLGRLLRRGLGRETSREAPAPDVVLSLSGYIVPDQFPYRNVLVFADLQHEYHPEFFSPETLAERRRVFATSLAQAERVIAISEHTRRTVLERSALPPGRVTWAHLAADPCFRPENWRAEELPRVMAKYRLSAGGYLFFPAHTWPHKNHVGAVEALAVLRDRHGLTPLLALSGGARDGEPALRAALARLGLETQVRALGYCPLADMPALYRGAAALFYPSFFEGFGIPLVEAMGCECPIVCSNATSLPEIAGDAALLVDAAHPADMAAALACVLRETETRALLIERGRRQARRFSWRAFTQEVLRTVYEVQARPSGATPSGEANS